MRSAMIKMCFFFYAICKKVLDVSKLEKLQIKLLKALCLFEQYYPPSFFNIMVHLIVHLIREVRLERPVYFCSMYPFERLMKVLKGYIWNQNRPEGCIVESYIVEKAIEFCLEYISDAEAIGILKSRNE